MGTPTRPSASSPTVRLQSTPTDPVRPEPHPSQGIHEVSGSKCGRCGDRCAQGVNAKDAPRPQGRLCPLAEQRLHTWRSTAMAAAVHEHLPEVPK
mmetsp:Transcript_41710/g.116249  ORF Transcript_41710/g.116249 Transcript_41710/m.116249 type:complete len:95 (-) Transcript_41710:750-1034(-)